MNLLEKYVSSSGVKALHDVVSDSKTKKIFLTGLSASATSVIIAALYQRCKTPILFIADDEEEAGYLYHDLSQIINRENVYILPSSYKRAIK